MSILWNILVFCSVVLIFAGGAILVLVSLFGKKNYLAGAAGGAVGGFGKVKNFVIPIAMLVGGNAGLWLVTSGMGMKSGLFTLYAGLNIGVLMLIGLSFLPIKGSAKFGVIIAILFLTLLVTSVALSPTKEEQVKAQEMEMLQPLQLMGWRGSEIITTPVKGTTPTDWSRIVITRENQEVAFQGLDSTDYIARDGIGRLFKPYEKMPVAKSLPECTYRFQAIGSKPTKIQVIWSTK